MFADKFSNLISRYPDDSAELERIANFFAGEEIKRGERYKALKIDPARMLSIAQTGDVVKLAHLIELLLSERILERRIVVRSKSGEGIADYSSYSDIPPVVRDITRDVDMEVTPEDLAVWYRPVA